MDKYSIVTRVGDYEIIISSLETILDMTKDMTFFKEATEEIETLIVQLKQLQNGIIKEIARPNQEIPPQNSQQVLLTAEFIKRDEEEEVMLPF